MAEGGILDPDAPLTRSDARMLSRLAKDKQWLANLTPDLRHRVAVKVMQALDAADAEDIYGQRVIGSLAGVLSAMDANDREWLKLAMGAGAAQGGVTNNTQINIGADLSKLSIGELKARLAAIQEARRAGTDT